MVSEVRADVPFLTSRLLTAEGFQHGFSLRAGGVSEPPFDHLNLGRALGDRPEAVAENHRRLAQAIGYPYGRLYEMSQVHGAVVGAPDPGDNPEVYRKREGDALLAAHPGQVVGVRTADCLAVLLADPRTGRAAAVHAGWRGVVAGVVGAAAARLCSDSEGEARVPPARLVAALMPHIRKCCFEVGTDVAAQLAATAPEVRAVAVPHADGKTRVELAALVRGQLTTIGVPRAQIDDVPGCTVCEPERFFSFRRDRERAGRHLAVIAARAGADA